MEIKPQKEFTQIELDNLDVKKTKQFIIGYVDHNGEVFIKSLAELNIHYEHKYSNHRTIEILCDDCAGETIDMQYIENNRLLEVIFV